MRRIRLSNVSALSIALILALCAAATPLRAEEFLQVRVNRAGGDVTFVVPRQVVNAITQMKSGATMSLGSFKGKDVRLSLDRFARALGSAPTSSKESLLMTRQSDLGPVRFYVRSLFKEVPPRRPSPTLLSFDLQRKGSGENTHLVLPLAGAGLIAQTLSKLLGLQMDSDMNPFFENCLKCARDMGAGPLLRVSGSDAEIVMTTD